jgi:plastocyanin
MRRTLAAAVVAVGLLAACSDGGGASAEPVETNRVDLPKSYRFEPASITIDAGTTVTWTNNDDFPHNVHLLDGSDRTVDLPVGGEGSLTFEEPGEIEYECSLHPQQMRGSITVA